MKTSGSSWFDFPFSTPDKYKTDEPLTDELEDELRNLDELQVGEVKGDEMEEKNQKHGKKGEEVDEDDRMEWDLRNTDSVFSELSELSRDYLESVDQGASIRGKRDHWCYWDIPLSYYFLLSSW